MKSKVIVEATFEKPAKRLAKRYSSFLSDLLRLIDELEETPLLGVSLGGNLRKVRLIIKSKAKGKSGGARVITYVYVARNSVHLLTIYDKSEAQTISEGKLRELAAGVLKSIGADETS